MESGDDSRTTPTFIYCLNCFYNLYGLAEPRCPECGRRFDPTNPRTYSLSPDPERLPKIVQRMALAINDTLARHAPTDVATAREQHWRRRLQSLERDNAALHRQLELLLQTLEASGAISPEQMQAIQLAGQHPDEFDIVADEDQATEDSSPELADIEEAQREHNNQYYLTDRAPSE